MTDAYQKVVERLDGLSLEDQAWLVAGLPAAHREPVTRMLWERRNGPPEARVATVDATINAPVAASGGADPDADALVGARTEDVEVALESAPDWLLALLLADPRWPWAASLLARYQPDRLQELAVLARRTENAIKPAVRSALVSLLADFVRASGGSAPAPNSFELTLQRLLRGASGTAVSAPQSPC